MLQLKLIQCFKYYMAYLLLIFPTGAYVTGVRQYLAYMFQEKMADVCIV